MSILSVLNDTHIGVIRSSGTTPKTTSELRHTGIACFNDLLVMCKGTDLLINGDLFDTSNILYSDLWDAMEVMRAFLLANPESTVWCARGNHDIARNGAVLSSFDLFCRVMTATCGGKFITVDEPTYLEKYDAYVLPHLRNQDLFDEAISKVPKCTFLFLHCNYDNKFAVQSDHSLNLTQDQAIRLPVDHIIFGHEHQAKTALKGKVVITGNQIPTSVADCLGNDTKHFLQVGLTRGKSTRDGAYTSPELRKVVVWSAEGDFEQQDWRSLRDTGARFIRVIGDATYAEAAEVVTAISKFRSKSEALVITNAVVVEGTADQAELEITAEKMAAFDVKAALFAILDPEEVAVVTQLLEDNS